MKKILLFLGFLVLFLMPNVKADSIKINSIDVVKKSDSVREIEKPSFSGMNLDLDLQLYKVGDYVEYKIVVQNVTNEDVVISNNGKKKTQKGDSIVYNYIWDNNDSTIKAGETKSFDLKVQYANKISEDSFDDNGNYTKTDIVKIAMDQEKEAVVKEVVVKPKVNTKTEVVESPETGDSIIDFIVLIIIAFTLIFDFVFFGIIKKENKKSNRLILISSGVLLLASIVIKMTFAYKYANLNITSNVKISKLPEMKPNCLSNVYTNNYISNRFLRGSDDVEKDFNYNKCFTWENILPIDNKTSDKIEDASDVYLKNGEETSEDFINNISTKVAVITTTEMPETYILEDIEYTLERTVDLSKNNDESVIAGIYDGKYNKLVLIGGEGGVKAPKDSGWLFAGNSIMDWDDESLMEIANYGDFQNLDVSDVKNMSGMFSMWATCRGGQKFNVSTWKTPKLKYMNLMFAGMYINDPISIPHKSFSLSLNNFDTSNVVSMMGTFYLTGYFAYSTNVKIDKWDTSKVKDITAIFAAFQRASKKIVNFDITTWDFSNVKQADYAYAEAFGNLTDLKFDWSNFDFSNVESAEGMFDSFGENSVTFDLNLSNWKTDNLQNIDYMFDSAGENAYTYNLNAANWNVSEVTDAYRTFCRSGEQANNYILDLRNWNFKSGAHTENLLSDTARKADSAKYYLNSMDFNSYQLDYGNIFSKNYSYYSYTYISPNAKIYVKNQDAKDFVLSDTGLNNSNVIISPIED